MSEGTVSIWISLGKQTDLGITSIGTLVIRDETGIGFDLGPATVRRITAIQEYLERLKPHAVLEMF